MITDSQVGIPRMTGLRRTEQRARPTVRGFITDHYVAKLMALLFAVVVIMLIDRELETKLLDKADFDVRVGDSSKAAAEAPGRRQIVLEPEPRVAVRSWKQQKVSVTVEGPEKLRDRFTAKTLVASVPLKQSWLQGSGAGVVTRRLDGGSVQFPGVRGVTITIDPAIDVEIETEAVVDLPLTHTPQDLESDLTATVTFDPPTMRVLGPGSRFRDNSTISIPISMKGRTQPFDYAVTDLPPHYQAEQIRMAPDQRIVAHVEFSKSVPQTFAVGDVPLRCNAAPDSDYKVEFVGLPRNAVTVNLSGTPDEVTEWSKKLPALRQQIHAMIDVEKLASRFNLQPGEKTSVFAEVEVFGVPARLKLESVSPSPLDVSVTKRN